MLWSRGKRKLRLLRASQALGDPPHVGVTAAHSLVSLQSFSTTPGSTKAGKRQPVPPWWHLKSQETGAEDASDLEGGGDWV